jgi:septal ring factor EnvC (AmiA/AmiB activator)
MTEQSYVTKSFFISLVSHTRSLFFKANQDANTWLKEVMNPLVRQIKEHKTSMEKRLETLRRISESRDTLETRIKELDTSLHGTRKQIDVLQQMRHTIHTPLPGATNSAAADVEKEEAMV